MNENKLNSFIIENNELQNYSMNIVHYFLEKQNYSIFNFQEKILENFNHEYYNIVMVYSDPLYNDVNIDKLIEKLVIIKKRLRRQYLVLNPSILIIATNSDIKEKSIELPKNVDLVNAKTNEQLLNNDIIKQVYNDIVNFPLDLSFEKLTLKINMINIAYANKIKKTFNKKTFIINAFLLLAITLSFIGILLFSDVINNFVLIKEGLLNNKYYLLLTNSLIENDVLSIIVSFILIFNIGMKLEKIYGSYRYLVIIVFSILLSNVFQLAFIDAKEYFIGFTPVIYGLIGAFGYVFLMFRRFFAHQVKRILSFIIFVLFISIIFLDYQYLSAMIGSLIGGFLSAVVVGIPNVKNINLKNRVIIFIFLIVLIVLSVSIGLKQF